MKKRDEQQSSKNGEFSPSPRRMALVAVAILAAVFWLTTVDDNPGNDEEMIESGEAEVAETPVFGGSVVDQDGRPVPEAEVSSGEKSVETNQRGRFSFSSLEAGTHLIDVETEDYVRAGVDDSALAVVVLEHDDQIDDYELVVEQPVSVAGRVTAGGEPVDGAEISISYDEATGLEGQRLDPYILSDVEVTDEEGRFSVENIAPGNFEVFAEGDEGFATSGPLDGAAGEVREDIAIDLAPSGVLEGRVTGEGGEPVSADLELTPIYADHPSRGVRAGDDGTFTVEELEEGTFELAVDAQGFRKTTIQQLHVRADETTTRDIELEESRGIVGRVVEPDGTPVEDANVTIENGDETRRTETDEEGRFQWENITSGEWHAVANSSRHDPSPPTPLQPDREIAVELTPGGQILGRVLDERNHPVTEFSVTVSFLEIHGEDRDHVRELPPVEIEDRRGRFEVGPVPTGRYKLSVEAKDRPGTVSDDIEVEAGDSTGPITIELGEGSAMYGTVRDAETGSTLEGAQIVHDDAPGTERPVAESDVDGFYELENLPVGIQRFRIEHDNYVTEVFDGVEIFEGADLEYDIELEPVGDGPDGFARYETGAIFGTSDGEVEVLAMSPGSPAADSELEVGDVVEAVDGVSTDEMDTDTVIQRIRGDTPIPVTLDVRRSGRGPMTIEVNRHRQFTAQRDR